MASIKLNPDQQRATNLGRAMGLLSPNEVAKGGLLQSRINEAGVQDQYSNYWNTGTTPSAPNAGGYQPGVNPTPQNFPQYNAGVQPIAVEPLHPWEKQGMTALAGGPASNQYAEQAAGMLAPGGAMSQFLSTYTTPTTAAQVQNYMNPFESQVVDAARRDITSAGERARAKLLAGDAGSRSFGDSSQAIQLSQLAKNMLETEADTLAGLRYKGYNDAMGFARGDREIAGNAVSLVGQQASGLAGLGQTINQNNLSNIQNMIGAGSAVRGYNQGVLDLTTDEINRRIGFDDARLSKLANYLGAIEGGSQMQNYTRPSTLSRVATGLGGLGDYISGSGGGYLLGGRFGQETARPSTGFVGPMQPLF